MGRPPKLNRDEVADITLSFRFTPLEREALERLAQRRNAELRGSGATATATSLGRAVVRKELESSGVYAEVEAEWRAAGKLAAQPPAQVLLPGLGDVAPEARRSWGSSPAPAAPVSAAAPSPAVSQVNATPAPLPAKPPAAATQPPAVSHSYATPKPTPAEPAAAVEPPAPAREARPGKALRGGAKLPTKATSKPVKRSTATAPAPALKGKAKPAQKAKAKGKRAAATPPRGRR
ncbi:hypothetical protein [Sorangium sp. So ce693]|uniref:hypothetical protein n=1 Tax=Sorangium sp. So ce693 TaxID=3133318 RepID=UPI003F5FE4B8